jgi:chromosome segregation ATPase
MTEAANNHDVKDEVNNLMQLSRELRENELTIPDCVELINTIKSFKQKEVDLLEYDSFLDDFYIELKKRELSPSNFIKYASILRELSESEGYTYSELIDEISLNRNINNSLKSENEELENQLNSTRKILNEEQEKIEEANVELEKIRKTKSNLLQHGLDFHNLENIENLIRNLSLQDYDVESILSMYSEQNNILNTITELKSKLSDYENKNQELTDTYLSLTDQIEKKKELGIAIRALESRGLDPDSISLLMDKVVSIGSSYNLSGSESMSKFLNDVEIHYDGTLGYESQINNLESRVSSINKQISQKEDDFITLTDIIEKRRKALETLRGFEELGIYDKEIVEWNNILQEHDFDLALFRTELEKFNGIESLVKEKSRELERLDSLETQLNNRIMELRNLADSEIEATRITLSDLRDTISFEINNIKEIMKQIQQVFTSNETGFLKKSIDIVSETHDKIQDTLTHTENAWNQSLSALESNVSKMKTQSDMVLENAYKGGRIVGRFHALKPINQLILEEEPSLTEAYLAMYTLMVYIRKWFSDHDDPLILSQCEQIISHIEGRLGESVQRS